MKIVLTDAQTVVDSLVGSEILSELGEVVSYGLLKYDEVAEKIADADAVIVNKTLMDSHTLRYAKKLKYIGLFATGYNNIDLDYCRAHGITACNAGSYSTGAVAQHTFALILAHFNRVAEYNQYVQNGKWKRSPTFSPFVYPLNELEGKTLGIYGLGAIGQAVAKIANSFGMPMIMWSIDTLDWSHKNAQTTYDTVMNSVQDGDIILMHEIYEQSYIAAQMLIPALLERGYRLVTVSELESSAALPITIRWFEVLRVRLSKADNLSASSFKSTGFTR